TRARAGPSSVVLSDANSTICARVWRQSAAGDCASAGAAQRTSAAKAARTLRTGSNTAFPHQTKGRGLPRPFFFIPFRRQPSDLLQHGLGVGDLEGARLLDIELFHCAVVDDH